MQDSHDARLACGPENQFHLPHSLATIAPVLLEDTRACRSENAKLSEGGARGEAPVATGRATSAEMAEASISLKW